LCVAGVLVVVALVEQLVLYLRARLAAAAALVVLFTKSFSMPVN
jgi:hypothetical protein